MYLNVMTRLFLEEFFFVLKLRPSGSNFRVYGLVLSDMYQKVVLYVFSNETFPFFANLEGDWSPPSAFPPL